MTKKMLITYDIILIVYSTDSLGVASPSLDDRRILGAGWLIGRPEILSGCTGAGVGVGLGVASPSLDDRRILVGLSRERLCCRRV